MAKTDRKITNFAFRADWLEDEKRASELAGYVSFTDIVVTCINEGVAKVRRERAVKLPSVSPGEGEPGRRG